MEKIISLLIFASLLLVGCSDKKADLPIVEQIKKEHPYYADTIELYKKAITEAWNLEKLTEQGINFESQDPNASLTDDHLFQVIEFEDTPPLLVTASIINDLTYIHEIYTVERGKAKRQFIDGIRTHLSIYQDGTIIKFYSNRYIGLFSINKDGEPQEDEVFEFDGNKYTSEKRSLTEKELEEMFENFDELEIDFIPFIEKEVEQADGNLNLSEMVDVLETNYEELNEYLLQANHLDDMFEKYHSYNEAEIMWKEGLDPSSSFYQEVEEWIEPQVKDLVTKKGLEAFINALFSRYYKTVAPDSFTQPAGEFKILAQTDDFFKLEQKKIIPAQEVGGSNYLDVFHISYRKEDDIWKFDDLEIIVWDQEIRN